MESGGVVRGNSKEEDGEEARFTLTIQPSENDPNRPAPFGSPS